MENTSNRAYQSAKKYSVVIEKNNNRVIYAEYSEKTSMVSLALDLYRRSNNSVKVSVICEDETIISFND